MKTFFRCFAGLLSLAAILWYVSREVAAIEPSYQGRSASVWLKQLDSGLTLTRDEARDAFKAMGAEAVPWLVEQMNSNRSAPWVRWEFDYERKPDKQELLMMTAATALGETGAAAEIAVPHLIRLSQHNDVYVRSRAKAALIKVRSMSLEPIKTELLAAQKTSIPIELREVLIGLGATAEPLVPILISKLDDPDLSLRQGAAWILGELRLRPEIVVPALAKNLSSENDNLRFSVATALRQYGSTSRPASEALIAALSDRWDYVAHNALLAIESFHGSQEAKMAVPALEKLLTHRTDFIRASATRTLARIKEADSPVH